MKVFSKFLKLSFIILMGIAIIFMNVEPKKVDASSYTEKVQEYRAVWVSHFVGDIPRFTTEEKYKSDFNKILDNMEQWGFNAMVFHVRTHNNALYKSELNPLASWWSEVNFDEFDPLEWMIEACHARGIEFHAWMNPYRISTSGSYPSYSNETKYPEGNPANDPSNFITVGNSIILDPGIPSNRDFIVDTCMELVENYDVDAIHFDDYFYISGADDTATRAKYNTENLSLANFRRKQVDLFIEQLHNELASYNLAHDKAVELGISPSGVYRNGSYAAGTTPTYDVNGTLTYPTASNTGGFAHYGDYLYSDTKHWIDQEWIDYITPQTYHSIDNQYSGFAKLAEWWNWVVEYKQVNLSMGIGIYMAIDNSGGWDTADELENQFKTIYGKDNIDGVCMYKYGSLLNTSANMVSHVNTINTYWKHNIPSVVKPQHTNLPEPVVSNIIESGTTLKWDAIDNVRGYMVWKVDKGVEVDTTNINHLYTYTQETEIEIETGYDYFVSSVNLANEISTPAGSSAVSDVERIITQINSIKFPVSLSDEKNLNSILTRYNALNSDEQEQITNYSILQAALNHLETLKEIDVIANEFALTLKKDVLDNYLLPLTFKDYAVSWDYANTNDARLYNIETGDVLVEYLATIIVPLKYTLVKDGISYVGTHNLNIGYVKQSEVGLFYRNTPNAMNPNEDTSANVSFIGWSGHILKFTLSGVTYLHFQAIGNYHEITSNDIPSNHWTSCGNLYKNVGTTSITATGAQFGVNPAQDYGYFIVGTDGLVRFTCSQASESDNITLKAGEYLYSVRYLDGQIEGSPLKPASTISVGTKVEIFEPVWQDTTTDQTIANEIIEQINSIQTPITLAQKDLIERCEKLYNNASNSIKALVTNYNDLVTARNELNILIEANASLNAAKDAAKNTIHNYIIDLSAYSETNQASISSLISLFETELSAINSELEINDLVTKYKKSLDDVPTIVEEEALIIASARAKAIENLKNYISDLSIYSSENQVKIQGIIATYTDKINSANTTAKVNSELANAKTEINKVQTIVQERRTEVINYLNETYDAQYLESYSTINKTHIRSAISTAKTSINKAKTVSDINAILENLEANLDSIKTIAEEKEELEKVKESLLSELDNYVNLENYSKDDQATMASIIRQYKALISASTKVNDALDLLEEVKAKLDEFVIDPVQIKRNEVLEEALEYMHKSGLEEGNIQLTNLHNSFVSDVAKATTVEEIDELLSTFKTDVDELVAEVNKPVDPDNGDNKDDDKTNVSCLSAAYISSLLLLFSLSAIIIKRKQ
ncbi:MAG: family 10 glycosylhydrolase [Bacilli bacterium]|nr:family 10 glycosylhydrolase [Bacilli bacterium]